MPYRKTLLFFLLPATMISQKSSLFRNSVSYKHGLRKVYVDKNNFQAMGSTTSIINQDNLLNQIESFNFNVIEINGHDETAIDKSISGLFSKTNNKPNCIVANTNKGKGISFMENINDWHYLRLDKSLYEQAMLELEK